LKTKTEFLPGHQYAGVPYGSFLKRRVCFVPLTFIQQLFLASKTMADVIGFRKNKKETLCPYQAMQKWKE
jgi:hypothetical protein